MQVTEGDVIQVLCSGGGNPQPTLTWWRRLGPGNATQLMPDLRTIIRSAVLLESCYCTETTVLMIVSVPDPPCTHKKKTGRKVPEEGLVQLIQKASMGCNLYGLLWVR